MSVLLKHESGATLLIGRQDDGILTGFQRAYEGQQSVQGVEVIRAKLGKAEFLQQAPQMLNFGKPVIVELDVDTFGVFFTGKMRQPAGAMQAAFRKDCQHLADFLSGLLGQLHAARIAGARLGRKRVHTDSVTRAVLRSIARPTISLVGSFGPKRKRRVQA